MLLSDGAARTCDGAGWHGAVMLRWHAVLQEVSNALVIQRVVREMF